MAAIEPYPSEEQRRRIMDMVIAAGQTLLENGAEVFRVEQTMQIMARSFHLREFNVYVLTNGIFASAGTGELSEVRNVPNRTVHLGRVAAVNALSRRCAAGLLTVDEAEQELVRARSLPDCPGLHQIVACSVGSFCFALLFGGALQDGAVAAVAGAVLAHYLLWCGRHKVQGMFQKMTGAALITLICICGCLLLNRSVSYAVIGTLMILTPGVAFTMGIRDFANSDYLSGAIRMIDALLVGACIACGTGFVMAVYSRLAPVAETAVSNPHLGLYPIQFVTAAVATAAFAVTFCVPKTEYLTCGLVGGVGWLTYCVMSVMGKDAAFATLVAAIPLTMVARILAIKRKMPVTVFLISGIFPMVPGAGIYYTAYYFIMNDPLCGTKGIDTLKIALALALGMTLVLGLPLPRRKKSGE